VRESSAPLVMTGQRLFAIATTLVLVTQMVFGCQQRRKCLCPALYSGIVFTVQASPDGGPVDGVQASVTNETTGTTGTMTCQVDEFYEDTFCSSFTGPVLDGSYTLQVTAPGYQPAEVPATITVIPGDPSADCGCGGATLSPSRVTLTRAPDGGP